MTKIVSLRVPDVIHAEWLQKAGGSGKLSAWIVERCNSGLTERDPSEYVPTTEADPGKGRKVGSQTRDAGAGLGQSRSVSPEQQRMTASAYQKSLKSEPFLIPAVEKAMGRPFKPDFKK